LKILECKKGRIYDIGFINPNTINEYTIAHNAEDTEKNLLKALIGQQNRREILFPYNFK
jgi:hypothetical protein